jgi:hypothetical protein
VGVGVRMGRGSERGHVGYDPRVHGWDIRKRGREQPARVWHGASGWRPKFLFVLGALLAVFVWAPRAHAFDCLPTLDAVKQQYPGSWPSWTLRAPGHAGERCWYPATRATVHHHPKWAAADSPARRTADAFNSRIENGKENPTSRSDTPSSSFASAEAPIIPVTTAIASEAISNDRGGIPATARSATNIDGSLTRDPVDQTVADLQQDGVPSKYFLSSEPMRETDQPFSTRALLAALGGALLLASMIAALVARLPPEGAGAHERIKEALWSRASDDLLRDFGSNAETNHRRLWRTAASPWD